MTEGESAKASEASYRLLGPSQKDLLEEVKPGPERMARLQALLAQWMRMENTVVLLAAGCSAGSRVQGKTLPALEEAVLSVLSARYGGGSGEHREKYAKHHALIEARSAAIKSGASSSFEEWLSYLSTTHHLLNSKKSPVTTINWGKDATATELDLQTTKDLLLDIERAVHGFCSLILPQLEDEAGPTGHHAFMAKLIARDPSLGRAHIFTLNYDTLIEQALDQLGILYFDGFGGRIDSKFDPSVYGLDVYYPGDISAGRVRRYDKFLHLYKLHGSIHWSLREDGTVQAAHGPLKRLAEWREKPPDGQAADLESIWPDANRRLAILPTASKYSQTLDIPFAHLFRSFYQRLHVPQTFFIVIGYGFGDEHVNQIIDAAMTNPSLIMLVVAPSPSDAVLKRLSRYQGVGERVFLLCPAEDNTNTDTAKFDDFATNVLPQVQWLDDFIKLRRYEKSVGQVIGDPPPAPGSGESWP